jgi:hypothetical protein
MVEHTVCPLFPREQTARLSARRSYDVHSRGTGKLHCRYTDSPACTMHEHDLSGLRPAEVK